MSRGWRRRMKETLGYVPKHKRFFADIRVCPICKKDGVLSDEELAHKRRHELNPYNPRRNNGERSVRIQQELSLDISGRSVLRSPQNNGDRVVG